MKLLIHLLLCVLPLNAKNCISDAGEKCLTKSQVGPYGVFMEKGDPCFLYKDARVSLKRIKEFFEIFCCFSAVVFCFAWRIEFVHLHRRMWMSR